MNPRHNELSLPEPAAKGRHVVNSTIFQRIRLLSALGLANVFRVALYRFALRSGYFEKRLPVGEPIDGPFLVPDVAEHGHGKALTIRLFGFHEHIFNGPPDWFANPWNPNAGSIDTRTHWSRLSDFELDVGDIKTVWEISRFDWLPRLVSEAVKNHDKIKLAICEEWVRDWCLRNPPNAGVNWKCAQEASLRTLNLLLAWRLCAAADCPPMPNLGRLMAAHVRRILPTVSYAIAQRNNHATSEAAALFCVGAFLARHGTGDEIRLGKNAHRKGRQLYERSITSLILVDGSFSQHSITYHRMLLDTAILVELVRRDFNLAPFSERVAERLASATHWLHAMVDPRSGDAPNLGDNDGAQLFVLDSSPYRDFRPTLHGALCLFRGERLAGQNSSPLLDVFGQPEEPEKLLIATVPGTELFESAGYARLALSRCDAFAVLRFPKVVFRPGHCDANHLDIWTCGCNLTRDGGTFSYNPDDPALEEFFGGTRSHCTVTFDGRDQMPAVGRFLRGEWLSPEVMSVDASSGIVKSAYTDYRGARHARTVRRDADGLTVTDVISGFDTCAALRWRLPNIPWTLNAGEIRSTLATLTIESDEPCDIVLSQEPESRHYLELNQIPVLIAKFHEPASVTTTIRFGSAP